MSSFNERRVQVLLQLAGFFAAEPAAVSVEHEEFGTITRQEVALVRENDAKVVEA